MEINNHFCVGDYVSYSRNGIFLVEDLRKESFGGTEKEYFILKSVYDKFSQVYVPADSAELLGKVKRILSAEEIDSIIDESESLGLSWIEDGKERALAFEEILNDGDRAKILWVTKVLSLHKAEVEKERRKFYASDERLLNAAHKIILGEFAFSLGIKKDEVIPYIKKRIGVE